MTEKVNHPAYYGGKDNPYECIKVMEAWDPVAAFYFCKYNAVKYLSRSGKKEGEHPLVDLDKAAWYSAKAAEIYRRHWSGGGRDVVE